jgi:hypothetical protein
MEQELQKELNLLVLHYLRSKFGWEDVAQGFETVLTRTGALPNRYTWEGAQAASYRDLVQIHHLPSSWLTYCEGSTLSAPSTRASAFSSKGLACCC